MLFSQTVLYHNLQESLTHAISQNTNKQNNKARKLERIDRLAILDTFL